MAYLHGIEREDLLSRELSGLRLGLITNPSGVDKNLNSTIDILREKFDLRALFSPEHGVRGDAQAGERVGHYTDVRSGLPVYTMYGDHSAAFDAFAELDCIVYDIQDVGLRFYTYIYTLTEAMTEAAKRGIRVVVLDRADPLGLDTVEGAMIGDDLWSGVGKYALPSRYGMTVGEFARYVNAEFSIGCELSVICCEGLKRGSEYSDLGIPWVLPSPNLPTLDSVLCYTGTVLFEGTNLSEGRGTTKPFELIGAPWLDSDTLVSYFNSRGVDGAILRLAYFVPTFSKHKGELCRGFQIHVTDRTRFKPFRLGLELVDYIRRTHEEFKFLGESENATDAIAQSLSIDRLLGSRELRVGEFELGKFLEKEESNLTAFKQKASKYYLY
ncbi:MAG: DUF1343 domain-containing protein [Clostridia bacterium]|nr:DUF1343 domain-containing protein [Clostridia bacterium]